MKSIIIFIAIIFISIPSNGQSLNNEHIIELGKHFSNFMFRNEPPEIVLDELGENYSENMNGALKFIKEITIKDNDILDIDFLTLPDSNTLRIVFIIDALHQNPHRKSPYEPNKLIDSLKNCDIPYVELVDEYYSTLFTSVVNKNKPFDLSGMNFSMKDYGLRDNRLKGIFYLRCMEVCGSQIFGFMNIVNPPNTSKALDYINDFPKFDYLEYYQYTDLHFEDFELEIINDKGIQSYKSFYIDKLYSTLLSHLICLNKEGEGEEIITDLLLGSILKDRILYKYTTHRELLEQLFEKQ